MIVTALPRLRRSARQFFAAARARVARWARLAPLALAFGSAADATRSRSELLLENALLRHQLAVYSRAARRPQLAPADRGLLVLLVGRLCTWADALVIVRPATVLRWHRQGFRLVWKRKSRAAHAHRGYHARRALIRRLAGENRLWGPTAYAGSC